ncbi:MAG: DUF4919 domain-containing protein [Planctomycetia bacterium]|nr:DUF4919 domain-containing protein [Planctomycetia bacterium]
MGLLDFLFRRGRGVSQGSASDGSTPDGCTPENAIVVQSIAEEYQWMQRHLPGYRPVSQALSDFSGTPMDVLTWANARGQQRVVYFDISAFFGK